MIQVVRRWNELWHHKECGLLFVELSRSSHQLYLVVFFVYKAEVFFRKLFDAVVQYLFGCYLDTVGVQSKNNELVLGVKSAYIERRVAFGKAQSLCLLKCFLIVLFFLCDFGKDIVGRAVENTTHFVEQLIVVILFQIAYNRNTSAGSSLIEQSTLVLFLQ